jgi:hypothetical protein
VGRANTKYFLADLKTVMGMGIIIIWCAAGGDVWFFLIELCESFV